MSIERIEDDLRAQIAQIKGWLKENAELRAKAAPEALPELQREHKMLARALKATRERLRDLFYETLERSCGNGQSPVER